MGAAPAVPAGRPARPEEQLPDSGDLWTGLADLIRPLLPANRARPGFCAPTGPR